MKITENADGTITLDPGRTVAELVEKIKAKDRKISEYQAGLTKSAEDFRDVVDECTRLKAELKASREAHHETTNELRDLKKQQEPAAADNPVDIIRTVLEEVFGPSLRKK